MKFCLVGIEDEILFIETNFCFAIPNKKEKCFEVFYHDEKLDRQNFKAKRIESKEFLVAKSLF